MPAPIRRRRAGTQAPFTVPETALFRARWLAESGTFQDTGLTTPAVANTDPVGGWTDQSGNGFTATQGTAGSRPTLALSVFPSGKPGLLHVAASNQCLSADALAASYTGTNLPFTFVVVYMLTANSVAACHCSMGRSASATPYSLQQISAGNAIQINRVSDAGTNINASVALPASKNNLNPHCAIFWYDGANAAVYLDGLSMVAPTAMAPGLTTLDRFTIGAWRRNQAAPPYASHFPGYIGEVAAYNGAITSDSMNRWFRYAAKAYGTPFG